MFERKCLLWVHDEGFSKEQAIINMNLFENVLPGDLLSLSSPLAEPYSSDNTENSSTSASRKQGKANVDQEINIRNRFLFFAKAITGISNSDWEISISRYVAETFSLKHRSNVIITKADVETSSASYIELSFKDEYLTRSDIWRLALNELSEKVVFQGQMLFLMGCIKAQIIGIYRNSQKVKSAFFSPVTVPIFRSGSARYFLMIQMSREMWEFDSEGSGEIMFNKVINGFLPTLFKKWVALKLGHLVSIILFTRVEYETGIRTGLVTDMLGDAYYTGIQSYGSRRPYKDFYRVVVSEMASGSWTTILYQLKREFRFFCRDISMHHINIISSKSVVASQKNSTEVLGSHFDAKPSLAMHGNILEAIDLACYQFTYEHIDQDLTRTGNSIVIITPCAGLFEVDIEILEMTTEILVSNGISIDLVCLPRMPLHCSPLFRYRNPEFTTFMESWRLKTFLNNDSTPRSQAGFINSDSIPRNSFTSLKTPLKSRGNRVDFSKPFKLPDEWLYAVPHWLNISFWTGPSQNLNSFGPTVKLKLKNFSDSLPNRPTDFVVRCKMYEMEMAGVIDNFLTEISLDPLLQDPLFLKYKLKFSSNQSSLITRKTPYAGLSELSNKFSESSFSSKLQEKEEFLQHILSAYNLVKSRITTKRYGSRFKDFSKKKLRCEDGESPNINLVMDLSSQGTYLETNAVYPSRTMTITRQLSRNNKSRCLSCTVASEKDRPDKDKIENNFVQKSLDSHSSSVVPSKVSRQISLGKYGFGITAPTVAAAEIHKENANAVKSNSISYSPTIVQIKSKRDILPNNTLRTPTSTISERHSSRGRKFKKDKSASNFMVNSDSTDPKRSEKILDESRFIKSALESLDSTNKVQTRSVLNSCCEWSSQIDGSQLHEYLQSNLVETSCEYYDSGMSTALCSRNFTKYLPTTTTSTTTTTTSTTTSTTTNKNIANNVNNTLSPWLTTLNPFYSVAEGTGKSAQNKRCRSVMANSTLMKTMKWKSLCSPASLNLVTKRFPTKNQIETEYQQKPYKISQNQEDEFGNEVPRNREGLLRELIGLRLSQGFQIVAGPSVAEAFGQKPLKVANLFEFNRLAEDGVSIFMSTGSIIHQISCVNDGEFEINIFVRKPLKSKTKCKDLIYHPAIRTRLSQHYESQPIVIGKSKEQYNWNYVDAFLGGFYEEYSDNLRFYRSRFVLIPANRPSRAQEEVGEDNEEEVRLEGIKRLTQMWQRYRAVTVSEGHIQNTKFNRIKDPNPLDIVYKTEDPSVVVTAELETLPLTEIGDIASRKGQLLGKERFRKLKLDFSELAEAIQAPVEKGGVRMQNRRWHLRLHHNCFIGSDMTTWLIDNFEDIETREKAVEFGNKLMVKNDNLKSKEKENGKDKERDIGMFVHVEGRHMFRDGQYFYQIAGEYAKQVSESRVGWFSSKKNDISLLSSTTGENLTKDCPGPEQIRSGSSVDEKLSDSGTTTPKIFGSVRKLKVILSKTMRYDVDHRKRSSRPEIINLHYDRLHNPDNCYHIRIDWLGVTTKLIKDEIESWARIVDRYGLRLVEVPIREVCTINFVNPFRKPYRIKILSSPPKQQFNSSTNNESSLTQNSTILANRNDYQIAILKKFNFVLDTEAASNFPANVDVSYSWGRPDYKFSQYIHRSGIMLAQIADDNCYLLLTNHLNFHRTVVSRDENLSSSRLSDISTPQSISDELEAFCSSVEALDTFYKELVDRVTLFVTTPLLNPKTEDSDNQLYSSVSSLALLTESVKDDISISS